MYKPPFDITSEMLHLISEISEQVGIINMRLGENAPSPQLRKKNQIKTIHWQTMLLSRWKGIFAFGVLEVIKAHPGLKAEDIGVQVSLSERQVKTYLNALKQAGLIEIRLNQTLRKRNLHTDIFSF